ncbi:hypothetical protein FKM82_002356 [Ascaphus truei]
MSTVIQIWICCLCSLPGYYCFLTQRHCFSDMIFWCFSQEDTQKCHICFLSFIVSIHFLLGLHIRPMVAFWKGEVIKERAT